ncbi:methylated-DNA--[protein]-cysteine S-methyltransferase [candidate division KSB1 bacterium]|nr:methylated-DNA--[protein]-cysteine S-methyltransferase [candidate division KSB1 bacterium]
MQTFQTFYHSPIGWIQLEASNEGITGVNFTDEQPSEIAPTDQQYLLECIQQLDGYFKSGRRSFSLTLNLRGTRFQQSVWNALMQVPFGEIRTYGQIAHTIGNPKAARAVGLANNRNRIGIIIPCHRVIGANGKLTGYAGGLWRKEWLLKHEREVAGMH